MIRWIAAALTAVLPLGPACAQSYPDRPIRLVVPYAPGGNLDITARIIGPALSERLAQPVVVQNLGGAGGTIGIDRVAKSLPDGYTLGLGATGPITLAPVLYPKNPYDPLTDLAAIGFVSNVPAVLLVHPSLPAKNVRELIALARQRPGELTLGGAGTSRACDLFQYKTGTRLILVRYYKGSAPGLADLMGGHIDAMIDQLSSASGHIKSGRLRALAVATPHRASLIPDVPTLIESGVKGAESNTFSGLFAPAGTPAEIVTRLSADLNKVLTLPPVKERFAFIGAEVWSSSPEQFAAYIKDDLAKWRKLSKEIKIATD